jgi:hypothetical protein
MSKPKPARYRTTNWSGCDVALRKRGSLLNWLDKEMAWHAPCEGRPGRRPVFSNAAIQFCLSITVLLKLPLRQTTGMVAILPILPSFGGRGRAAMRSMSAGERYRGAEWRRWVS